VNSSFRESWCYSEHLQRESESNTVTTGPGKHQGPEWDWERVGPLGGEPRESRGRGTRGPVQQEDTSKRTYKAVRTQEQPRLQQEHRRAGAHLRPLQLWCIKPHYGVSEQRVVF
jgi:hypothetical protein